MRAVGSSTGSASTLTGGIGAGIIAGTGPVSHGVLGPAPGGHSISGAGLSRITEGSESMPGESLA